jgi:hypothetical protein
MTCSELQFNGNSLRDVEMQKLDRLQSRSRDLLIHWFQTAWKLREKDPSEHTEAFLIGWNALIGWAECISGEEDLPRALEAVGASPEVNARYNQVFENKKSLFRMYAKRFAELWPVFDAVELDSKGLLKTDYISRSDLAEEYLAGGAQLYAPTCWKRHHDAGEEIPVTLPHLLAALYQLRKGLFQGGEAPHSEVNEHLLSTGYLAMVYYLFENKIYLLEPKVSRDLFWAELIY